MDNGHVTEKSILIGGAWSCYRSGHFNGERMAMFPGWPV